MKYNENGKVAVIYTCGYEYHQCQSWLLSIFLLSWNGSSTFSLYIQGSPQSYDDVGNLVKFYLLNDGMCHVGNLMVFGYALLTHWPLGDFNKILDI